MKAKIKKANAITSAESARRSKALVSAYIKLSEVLEDAVITSFRSNIARAERELEDFFARL